MRIWISGCCVWKTGMRGNSQRAAKVGNTEIFKRCSCDWPVASMPAATMRSSASRT